jgi:predicted P-loop ATPase
MTPPKDDDWHSAHIKGESALRAGDHVHARQLNGSNNPTHRDSAATPKTKSLRVPRVDLQNAVLDFLKSKRVTLRTNTFTQRDLVKIGDEPEVELSEAIARRLRLEADMAGIICSAEFFDDILSHQATASTFHPPRAYVDRLTWDGTPRLDTLLAKYFGAADTELHSAFGRKHLIGGVRRIRQPGCKHDAMLVLEGPQGGGKSTGVRILGEPWFSDALTIGAESKGVIEVSDNVWLAEIAEMTGIGRKEVEQVKAMISKQSDRARLSYDRRAVDRPRQFILFGTVNDRHYLVDPTGNRRFWPVRVGQIDLEGLRRDKDQIWAEAAAAEQSDESNDLPERLWEEAALAQAERVITDPWAEILVPLLEGSTGYVAIEDINARLGLDPKHRNGGSGRRIAAILSNMGFVKCRRAKRDNGPRVWCYRRDGDRDDAWIDLSTLYGTRTPTRTAQVSDTE